MPRIGLEDFRRAVGRIPGKGRAGLEAEDVEPGAEELITDEGEWKAKVSEIVISARGEIELITPPEFADRIDDEIRAVLGGGVEGGVGMEEIGERI